MVQLSELIITAPQQLCEQPSHRKTIRGEATLCGRLRPGLGALDRPAQVAKLALRALTRRIETLDAEIAELDAQLEQLVRTAAPHHAAAGRLDRPRGPAARHGRSEHLDRLRGDAAFAALCGANPIPASSGRTTRHRLNYGGDRDANRALHMIAVCRLRYCDRTRAYAKCRTADGKSKREIIRCLYGAFPPSSSPERTCPKRCVSGGPTNSNRPHTERRPSNALSPRHRKRRWRRRRGPSHARRHPTPLLRLSS